MVEGEQVEAGRACFPSAPGCRQAFPELRSVYVCPPVPAVDFLSEVVEVPRPSDAMSLLYCLSHCCRPLVIRALSLGAAFFVARLVRPVICGFGAPQLALRHLDLLPCVQSRRPVWAVVGGRLLLGCERSDEKLHF